MGQGPLSEVQAQLIFQNIAKPTKPFRILDVGCFDGKLLRALSKKLPVERCVGFDVAPRPGFPCEFKFVSGSLEKIEGEFDLITFSQSLMYIPNLRFLFKKLEPLLAATGIVFLHLPNVAMRPAALLFGDQYHYFTGATLASLFSRADFFVRELNSSFTRDLVVLAEQKTQTLVEKYESGLLEGLSQLNALATAIQGLSQSKDIFIFGTTVEAAFVHSLLDSHVLGFVDESEKRVGITFQGKPVIHPKNLNEESLCVIAMGKQSEALKTRLAHSYSGIYYALNPLENRAGLEVDILPVEV